MLSFVSLNITAVAVATVATILLGFLWYSVLFAKSWVAMTPGVAKRSKADMQKRMGPAFILSIISNAVMAFVLATIMRYIGAHTLTAGLVTGLWIGIGFLVASGLQNAMFSWKPIKLYLIDTGYPVVSLLLMGAIIGAM